MSQNDLFTYHLNLFEQISSEWSLREAYSQVFKNKGAPGIDGVTVEQFAGNLDKELGQLSEELLSWTYQPTPVKRVEIPKPDSQGVRLLGIPCVRDRVVQTSIKRILEPIFEPTFSENSYGFRPGRNQEQAVKAAQRIVQSGKEIVVDIDLSKFFDRIHHDLLIARIRQRMPDPKVLRLIGLTLRSGIMQDGLLTPSAEGTVQGGPLSPLLSNIVLDELDKELEKRGLEFCRFADDCNIFVRTEKSARRVMESITKFIEKKLKLLVNKEKSKVAPSKLIKFLGMTIILGSIAISAKSMAKAMAKVKELTPRGTHLSIEKTMDRINTWYVGWASYFKMTQYPAQLSKIEAHLRRRLRARIIGEQKRKRYLFNKLVKRGVSKRLAGVVFSHRGRWALSHTVALERAFPNKWFIENLGQKIRSKDKLEHWNGIDVYIKLM